MKSASSSSKAMPPAVEIARAIGARPVSSIGTALTRSASSSADNDDSEAPEAAAVSCSKPIAAGEGERRRRFPQPVRKRLFCEGNRQPRCEIAPLEIGPQCDLQGRLLLAEHCLAQWSRQRVDRTAFDAVPRDHRLAAHIVRAERQRDAFQRLPLKTAAKDIGPCNRK